MVPLLSALINAVLAHVYTIDQHTQQLQQLINATSDNGVKAYICKTRIQADFCVHNSVCFCVDLHDVPSISCGVQLTNYLVKSLQERRTKYRGLNQPKVNL